VTPETAPTSFATKAFVVARLQALGLLTDQSVQALTNLTDKALRTLAEATDAQLRAAAVVAEQRAAELEQRLSASFITAEQEAGLPGSRQIVAGAGVRLDSSQPGRIVIDVTAGMGGGFPLESGVDSGGGVFYLPQFEADRSWADSEFRRGTNIIGVRAGDAIVRIPHNLAVEKIVHVKSEIGGSVSVVAW